MHISREEYRVTVSKKYGEYIFYILLIGVSFLALLLFGEGGYYEYTDSYLYIQMKSSQGVVPLYPLFIHAHRKILGEEFYLYGVVISQTVLCIACVTCWNIWIRRRFKAGYFILALVYLVSLIPFTIDMPITLINHSILTEALAYPLFYIFVIFFMEAAFRKKIGWGISVFGWAILMALIRTQMQICLGFAFLDFVYILWNREKKQQNHGRKRKFICYVFSVVSGLIAMVLGEIAVLQINQFLVVVQQEVRENYFAQEKNNKSESLNQKKSSQDAASNMTGQFDSILIDKTFYEIEENDWIYFKDKEVQELVRDIYAVSEEEQSNYKHSRNDLWKWQDIMNGTAGGTSIVRKGWENYLEDNPDSILNGNQKEVNRHISFVLLKKHWPRILYHMLCMLPQGFICTVFFQIEEIYGLCHAYTLLIYTAAIILMIYGIKKRKVSQSRYELMAGILTLNIGMVVVICTVFFGMQRYLIYGFGIFYTAFLLMLEDIWHAQKQRRERDSNIGL